MTHRYIAVFEDLSKKRTIIMEGYSINGWAALGAALLSLQVVEGYTDEELHSPNIVLKSFSSINDIMPKGQEN